MSRLTDDQSQPRIRHEADAIESILLAVAKGSLDLISSEPLEDEVRRNPNTELRLETASLLLLASTTIQSTSAVAQRAKQLAALGYGSFDALHLASAEAAKADLLMTTDDHFLKLANRNIGNPLVKVENPLSWTKDWPQ